MTQHVSPRLAAYVALAAGSFANAAGTANNNAISNVTTTTTTVARSASLGEEKWTLDSSVQDSLKKLMARLT